MATAKRSDGNTQRNVVTTNLHMLQEFIHQNYVLL